MRVLILLTVVAAVSALSPKFSQRSSSALRAKSASVPFLEAPAALDGSMAGDVGFDPFGFTGQWLDVSGSARFTSSSPIQPLHRGDELYKVITCLSH